MFNPITKAADRLHKVPGTDELMSRNEVLNRVVKCEMLLNGAITANTPATNQKNADVLFTND
jgi:hypothetical protein